MKLDSFRLGIRHPFLMVILSNHWNNLPKVVVDSLSLAILKSRLDVKKHKKFLLDILIGALHDIFSSEVIGESMNALAKVLKKLKEKDIGSSFRDLTQQIRTYFDDEDAALRSVAFVLFGILAQLTKKKWKAYFTEQVRKSWVTLLLHLQDPDPKVSMVRLTVTYFLSQRNLPPNARGALLFLPVVEAQILPLVHCPPAESVPAGDPGSCRQVSW
uniref:Maestro/Maestro-like HEAT-repeats domain-containing protein n=1 Tax=Gopherus evgoodei TaxID=1825980 RepID=A0A8C4VRL6_9SAUR